MIRTALVREKCRSPSMVKALRISWSTIPLVGLSVAGACQGYSDFSKKNMLNSV